MTLESAEQLEARLLQIGAERYHNNHPFHFLMRDGALGKGRGLSPEKCAALITLLPGRPALADECLSTECKDKDEQASGSSSDNPANLQELGEVQQAALPEADEERQEPRELESNDEPTSRLNSNVAKATPTGREGFDGRWVFEITDTDNLSATDRRIVEIKDNKFTVDVSTNGWRGKLQGEINKFGRLVGQGTVSRMGLVSNNIAIHFTPHYRSGGFQEDVQARARYPLTFRIKLMRDERVEALRELE